MRKGRGDIARVGGIDREFRKKLTDAAAEVLYREIEQLTGRIGEPHACAKFVAPAALARRDQRKAAGCGARGGRSMVEAPDDGLAAAIVEEMPHRIAERSCGPQPAIQPF